jgi:glycosyltransferase involved in cell wall biosynthesis
MKIAVFHNLPAGGAKRALYEQVKELTKRGHVVHEYTQTTADLQYLPLADLVSHSHVQHVMWRTLGKVPIKGIGPAWHLLINYRNLQVLRKKASQLATQIDAGGYDLVFLADCRFITIPFILRYLSTPRVLYIHSLPQHYLKSSQEANPPKTIGHFLINRIIKLHQSMIAQASRNNIHWATRVITNSLFSREIFLVNEGIDSYVVYPGIDTTLFTPAADPGGGCVITVGTINDRKNPKTVVDSIARVPENIRPRIIFASATTNIAAEKELLAYSELKNVRSEVIHARGPEEMVHLYHAASLGVFTPRLEPLGLAVLEAMSCGLPVVGVREGGLRETIIHGVTGLLCDGDPDEIAHAIATLLKNKKLCRQMGNNARAEIETHWTWSKSVDNLESQFRAVLS